MKKWMGDVLKGSVKRERSPKDWRYFKRVAALRQGAERVRPED